MFKSKLREIGNSLGVIIPREFLEGFEKGDELELEILAPKKIKDVSPIKIPQVIKDVKPILETQEVAPKVFWCEVHGKLSKYCGCVKKYV